MHFTLTTTFMGVATIGLFLFLNCILLWRIFVALQKYLQKTSTFRKLPQLPAFGRLGWLLGNVDIYLYAMRHLSIAEGNLAIN